MIEFAKRYFLKYKEHGMCEEFVDKIAATKDLEELYKTLTHPYAFEYLYDNWGNSWFITKQNIVKMFGKYLNTYKNKDCNSLFLLNFTGLLVSTCKVYLFVDSTASIRLSYGEIIYVYNINSHLNFTGNGGVIMFNKGEIGYKSDSVNIKIIK